MGQTPEQDTAAKRKDRYNDVVSGVFGLILGLSAFSLTGISFDTRGDLWEAMGVFIPSFFLVVVIWQLTSELADRYPDDDSMFYPAVTGVLFLTTLAPAFLNLLIEGEEEVRQLSAILFPVSLAITFGIIAFLWARLRLLIRRAGQPPEPDIIPGIAIEMTVALYFLATLAVPYDDASSPRVYAWFGSFLISPVVGRIVARVAPTRRQGR
jgi:uncharacterized membrane protein